MRTDCDEAFACASIADQAFITLGWGRDYGDVAPLRGVVWGGGKQQLNVRVTVTPR